MTSARTRLVVGCMTGTSIDGIDAAAVEITGRGLGIAARMVGAVTLPLGAVGEGLRALAEQRAMRAGEIAALSRDFALLHVEAIRALLAEPAVARSAHPKPDLIAAHGQTVYHAPPLSWQLLNAAPIAHAFSAPVVFDLRAADLAAGGQGAPITPLSDWVLFRRPGEPVAVANLGGFCNITLLPPSAGPDATPEDWAHEIGGITGFDLCACNQLLDAVARLTLGIPFDPEGRHAAAGRPDAAAAAELEGLLTQQRRHGRSLGTGDELAGWVERSARRVSPQDLLHTAAATLGSVIASAAPRDGTLLLAGGGTRNAFLVEMIRRAWVVQPLRGWDPVLTTDQAGIPAGYREAVAMAILGALCQDRIPITLPRVTRVGVPVPVSGVWVLP